MKEKLLKKIKNFLPNLTLFCKWTFFPLLSGVVIGLAGCAFYYCLYIATNLRMAHPWLIFLLPVGGLCIAGLYHLFHNEKDPGTNLVLSAIQSGDNVPLRMAPSIFISTVITHLFGGSAGREGAALQLGGSLGNAFGKLFHMDEKDSHIMIMCGMSAAFSALFGTPMAAAVFAIEVISVGIMHYSALLPCILSSLAAHGIAMLFGFRGESFTILERPDFTIFNAVRISLLAVLCALLSILFCITLHKARSLYKKYLKNPYLRIFTGGCFVVVLTLLIGNQDYNGAGMQVIARCMEEAAVRPEAFLLKILLTAVTLGAGFKGGEIVPSLFIGATFGCLFGNLLGFSPTLCAAVGICSVFCGVTNCPISSLLISFELFGFDAMPYFLLAIGFSYLCSGYFGLYQSQKIVYSKTRPDFINRKTKR